MIQPDVWAQQVPAHKKCQKRGVVMRRKTYKQSAVAGITCLALLLGPGLAVNVSAALDGGDKIQGAKSPRGEANSALLSQVHLDGTYFVRNGKRFVPVGAHWVPAKAAMQWPVQWDPKDIEADFAKMHELGYSIVRFDMVWPWFEPRPGDYNPVAFQQLFGQLSRDLLSGVVVGIVALPLALAFAIAINKDVARRILAVRYQPAPDSAEPSWLTVLGHTKDSCCLSR